MELEERPLSVRWVNSATALEIAESVAPYGREDGAPEGFKQLRVWQLAVDLVAVCYSISTKFPTHEQFGLTSQLRRAAASVALNIAEGWGRNRNQEFARFAEIARGSLNEVDCALEIAVRLEYVQREDLLQFDQLNKQLGRMLYRLIAKLRKG